MEHEKILEDLNKQSLEKIEEYMKSKGDKLKQEEHNKLNEAKDKWQSSWNDFMDILMYLERIEI